MNDSARTICRTPAAGRDGTVSIPTWKYDAVRAAILDVVAGAGDDGFPFSALPAAVKARMTDDVLARLGSVGWHTTTVKLNMEVDGDLRRVEGKGPQRLILASRG